MRGIPRQGGFYYLERGNLGRVIEVLAQNMYTYKTNTKFLNLVIMVTAWPANIKMDWDLQQLSTRINNNLDR
jgi:hypothetical protein